jgi:zinc ribbon protein
LGSMSQGPAITQELSIGDVISKTLDYYRHNFTKYLILFGVVEAIVGVITTAARAAITLPTVPTNATSAQIATWVPQFIGAVFGLFAVSVIVAFVFYPIAYGTAVKMASDDIEKGQTDLGGALNYAVSRLVWLWAVGIVVGILVGVGSILIIPGIILAIMFSMSIPAVIVEKMGFDSLGRSRKLVANRWLKTFAMALVFGIAILIASVIVGLIAAPFGVASTFVSSVLSALYLPVVPIALTVYYYSNAARIAPLQGVSPPTTFGVPPASMTPSEPALRFCSSCGSQLTATAQFCPNCGAKQAV